MLAADVHDFNCGGEKVRYAVVDLALGKHLSLAPTLLEPTLVSNFLMWNETELDLPSVKLATWMCGIGNGPQYASDYSSPAMNHSFDGHGLSREQLQAKAEAAAHASQLDGGSSHDLTGPPSAPRPDDACEWRGDVPDPELDDLAHACEKNQQPSRSVDTCDWHGDEPEQHEDDLGQICQPDNQAQKSDQRHKPVEETDSVKMPIPRPSKVARIPESRSYSRNYYINTLVNDLLVLPPASDKSPDQKHDPQPVLETPSREEKRSDHKKRPKLKKAPAGNTAGPSNAPPGEHGATNEHHTEGRTHSPWVDSLEQMPASMIEKVNRGVKETLEAAASILTSSAQKKPLSQEPAGTEMTRRSSGLAPVSAAPPPPDFYIAQPPNGQLTESEENGDNKKHKRERSRSEKKAQREAKRRARQEKTKERRETRKEEKEMRRKERQWKKTAKKGGELPLQLRQGLRLAPGSKVPYNSKCDICTKAAASAMSSKKRNPKCTTCAKAAEHESTDQYLKSLKINLGDLPSLDGLLDFIRGFLGKKTGTEGGARTSDQSHADEELLEHIALHIRDFAANGGECHLRGHKCNKNGQPGHLGRHGLDGNRDSPTTTDGEQTVSNPSRNSDSPTISSPPAVDWWVRAMSSKELPSTPYRSNSPPRAVTPFPRPKTTVYEPRTARYSVPNRLYNSSAAYHFYLPFAICHNCCSPGQPTGVENWRAPPSPQSLPPFSTGYSVSHGLPVLNSGWAETLPSNSPRPSQDRVYHPRSRSGSI
ncbi:hypothetical protein CHU98_g9760 [Xylaria longipes]|nr:hypothetical protein CHU98_g9760 [Xylaria longipes]